MSNNPPRSNLSSALSPRYADAAKKAGPFAISGAALPVPAFASSSSSSSFSSSAASAKAINLLSQSAPVHSAFLAGFPVRPNVRPVEPPPTAAAPPPLALPMSLPDSESALDVWQVGDKLGRSFYSSSMPANITQRGMFGGRAERDAASHGSLLGAASASSSAASASSHNASAAGAGRRRAVSDATAAGATATIFGFMSGGSHTDPSQLDALGRAGVLGAGGAGSLGSASASGFGAGLSQSLSAASPGHRGMGRFRDSIAEEAPAAFEDSDEEFGSAVRRGGHGSGSGKGRGSAGAGGAAKSGHASSSKPRSDSIVDDLQFNLSLDPEEDD